MHKPTPKFSKPGSVEVAPPARSGEGPTRRNALTADRLVTQPFEGIEVVPDILAYAARTHGQKDAMGWREVVDIHEEEKEIKKVVDGKQVTEKKKWKYFQLSEYKYVNYVEVKKKAELLGAGLVQLGVGREGVFNVYSQTSLNWQLISHACSIIGTPIATAYDTLGESGLTHSLNEPECVGIFTNTDLLPVLARVIKDTPTIRLVIYDGDAPQSIKEKIEEARPGVKVLSIDELAEQGKLAGEVLDGSRAPTKDDVACIMYTSGTTGPPKGVVITHANLIASVGAIWEVLGHQLKGDSDTFLAYLPLAHILEYIVELAMLFVGMTIGYGRVRTLTDQSVRNCKGDIREFRPSIMVGVPAVWETIRKGILAKVNSSGSLSKNVFNGSIAIKKAGVPVLKQLVDSAVFSKVKEQTGGRLRLALSGGAALSRETQEFLSLALVTMLQGYGMTESCGMCAILPPEWMQYGSVGLPVPSTETKLMDVAEAGYLSTNNPPQGEVLIRGPSVIKGYYKRDDLNSDETIFTKDGWFRTGDVGQWNPDGTLSLIDRIKNLVKLQGGEYIALEHLESTYKSCNLVSNICVHATTDAKQPIAIIIPHEQHLRHALQAAGNGKAALANKSLHDLCEDAEVKEIVLKSCNAAGKKSGFKSIEVLQAVVLTPEEWTPENELVTAAQKIQRKKIAQKFDAEIKAAYKESQGE